MEVRPNLLSGEMERFLLEDIYQAWKANTSCHLFFCYIHRTTKMNELI